MVEVVPKKTVIRVEKCPACGGRAHDTKINSNGVAYSYCGGLYEGRACTMHMRWPRKASEKFVREYMAAAEAANDNRKPEERASNDNRKMGAGRDGEHRGDDGGGDGGGGSAGDDGLGLGFC